jgi:hypothetical protein
MRNYANYSNKTPVKQGWQFVFLRTKSSTISLNYALCIPNPAIVQPHKHTKMPQITGKCRQCGVLISIKLVDAPAFLQEAIH